MELNSIKSHISALGFTPKNNVHNIYHKIYSAFDYEIHIDLNAQKIIYSEPLRLGDKTTSNFNALENLCVLECVDRLISQGYDPQYIELERNFPLGHKTKGKLDISVYNPDGTTFLMIECKTFGSEYDKAKKNTLKDGGQLLSYYQQDNTAHFLCLYASKLDTDRHYCYDVIECTQSMRDASDTHSKFAIWNKQFKNNGLFETNINPYNFKPKALRKIDLKPLEKGDSSIIFNEFEEILRHNVISDNGNAFNKIFNLFLCKLNDERKLDDAELDFQWKEKDTAEDFLMRLNEIYANSVKEHLNKNITNLTQKQIEELFEGKNRNEMIQKVKEAILYKNNEFAFIDVFDEESFKQNAIIVREVVELLQYYQIRYGKKQQFLGDFFENLINTGIKQESGQFFTPVPLARFMINSLPLKEVIQEKLNNNESDFLPYIIDYAMGTGHFLTEAMDQIQKIIKSDNLIAKTTDTQKKLKLYQQSDYDFDWAKEFIYGLERDYRLVKTAKIACFFHGDGLANIIHGDGLDNFYHSKTYTGLLKLKRNTQDNQQFDIVVANPPYSVSAFKNTLKFGTDSFGLFNNLTDSSKEIECLFVERTKQLLKTGGYASVILPSSILSSTDKIYAKTRDILLKYFDIYAICEFGANTFAKTGTNTVVLFLKRRDDNVIFDVKNAVNLFFQNYMDVTVNHIENPFSNYAKDVHHINLDAYIQNLKTLNREQEIEKLNLYILNYKVQTLIVKSGDKDIEKEFLGYKFSNRRGFKGIDITFDEHQKPVNKLFNYDDLHDNTKVSAYIYQAGLGNVIKNIDKTLDNHLTYTKLNTLINFTGDKFIQEISLNVKKNSEIRKSKFQTVILNDVVHVKIGGTPSRQNQQFYMKGIHKWLSISELGKNKYIYDTKEKITDDGVKNSNVKLIPKNTVLLSFKLSIGKVSISGVDLYTNEAIAGLCIKDDTILNYLYLYYLFATKNIDLEKNNKNIFGKSLNSEFLKYNVQIPLPPIDIQKNMVARIEAIDDEIMGLDIKQNYHIDTQGFETVSLGNETLFLIKSGGTPSTSERQYWNSKDISWATIDDLPLRDTVNIITATKKHISHLGLQKSSATLIKKHSVLISSRATIGAVAINEIELTTNQGFKNIEIVDENRVHYKYLAYILQQLKPEILQLTPKGTTYQEFSKSRFSEFSIPLPPLSTQQKIVDDIDKQRKIIADNKQKIEQLNQKKQDIMNELWHEA